MVRLVVISKSLSGLAHELGSRWITIGRAPGNSFQISDSSVSGQHCEVLFRNNELLVRDMRSTNGTYIKDTLVTEGVVYPGATLRLGEVELRLEVTSSFAEPRPDATTQHRANGAASLHRSNGVPTQQVQVLLVDDSMAFLELAGEVFDAMSKSEWKIHQACGADQALSIMQQHAIKLAVLDLNMPMLDGTQLLGMMHRRHPESKLVILTGQGNEKRRAECLAAGAEMFLEKPITRDGLHFVFNVLNDLITWRQREGFSGTLQQVGLADVIQIECLRRNSCILEIHTNEVRGEIFLESGSLVHATTSAGLGGENALHSLLSLHDGQFNFAAFRQPTQRTLQGSWECLLMESARLRDEQRSHADKTTFLSRPAAPGSATTTKPTDARNGNSTESHTPKPANGNGAMPAELEDNFVVLRTYDGGWKSADAQSK